MNRNSLRIAAPAAALALALGLSACGAANESDDSGSKGTDTKVSGTLNAGGSSAQEAAVAAWKKAFQTQNPDATVNYDPVGSGGGREQFLAGGLAIAGSDAYLSDDELAKAKDLCKGDIVEVPVYVSPIAVIFNLDGVKELNLSPKTIADIFAGKITTWDDAAIKADNPDAKLPGDKITPVHRSDDSGTTQNFTDYMGRLARSQVEQSKQAFLLRDVAVAEDLVRQDQEINRLNRCVFSRAVEIGTDADRREWAMSMMLVARALERIGDNAVDIGEQGAFVVTGQFREFSDASHVN